MKRYLLIIPLFIALSGCAKTPYEQQLGLSPLAAPVAVAGAVVTQHPEPLPGGQKKKGEYDIEAGILTALTAETIAQRITEINQAQAMTTPMMDLMVADDLHKADRIKWTNEMLAYYLRAATIKKAQLESNDLKDSTGEVVKYINMARVSEANMDTLPDVNASGSSAPSAPAAPSGGATIKDSFTPEESAYYQVFSSSLSLADTSINSYRASGINPSSLNAAQSALKQLRNQGLPPFRFASGHTLLIEALQEMSKGYETMSPPTVESGISKLGQVQDALKSSFSSR